MEEKPAGNHRQESREAERVLLARALDARRLPARALAVRVPPANAAVARAPLANRADGRNALLHANPAEERSLFQVVRM